MKGWHVSLHAVAPGHQLPAETELLTSRRRCLDAAREADVEQAWLCEVKRNRLLGTEVLRAEEVRFPWTQARLFHVLCKSCGASFRPLGRGRPPTKCEACRKSARSQFFRARAVEAKCTS